MRRRPTAERGFQFFTGNPKGERPTADEIQVAHLVCQYALDAAISAQTLALANDWRNEGERLVQCAYLEALVKLRTYLGLSAKRTLEELNA